MEGSLTLALGAGLVLLGGFLVETRLFIAKRFDGYFLLGLPLAHKLVPIPRPPRGSGSTASVDWEMAAPHLVRFWARRGGAPAGLHGVVVLSAGRNGVELDVRWAPPWTLALAAAWLAGLGVARGDGLMACAIAVMLLGAVGYAYGERAKRVAAELRWAFVQGDEPDSG